VFLGIFSIFILAFGLEKQYLSFNAKVAWGLWIFIAGIIINELILMLQGLDAIVYTHVPFEAEALLGAAAIMFSGIFILLSGNIKNVAVRRKQV
jgi:hypothetical protein